MSVEFVFGAVFDFAVFVFGAIFDFTVFVFLVEFMLNQIFNNSARM
jgi:hypothetical protein